jgi:hypothetical protein
MLNLLDTQKLITLRAKLRWNLLHYVYRKTYISFINNDEKKITFEDLCSIGLIFIENCDNLKEEVSNAILYLMTSSFLKEDRSPPHQLYITHEGIQALERNFNTQGII